MNAFPRSIVPARVRGRFERAHVCGQSAAAVSPPVVLISSSCPNSKVHVRERVRRERDRVNENRVVRAWVLISFSPLIASDFVKFRNSIARARERVRLGRDRVNESHVVRVCVLNWVSWSF